MLLESETRSQICSRMSCRCLWMTPCSHGFLANHDKDWLLRVLSLAQPPQVDLYSIASILISTFKTIFDDFGKEWPISLPIWPIHFLHSFGDRLHTFLLVWNYNLKCLSLWHHRQQLLAFCWLPAIPATFFPVAFQEFIFTRHLQMSLFWVF